MKSKPIFFSLIAVLTLSFTFVNSSPARADNLSDLIAHLESSPESLGAFNKIFGTNIVDPSNAGIDESTLIEVATGYFGTFNAADDVIAVLEFFDTVFVDDPDNSNLDEAFDKIFGTTIGASGSGHIGYSNQNLFLQASTGYYGSFHSNDEVIDMLELFDTVFVDDPDNSNLDEAFDKIFGTTIGASGSGHIGYSNQGLFLQVATGYYGSFHSNDEVIDMLELFDAVFVDDPDNSNLDEAFDKIFGTTIGASGSGHIGYSNQGLFLQVATGYYGSFHSNDEVIDMLELFDAVFVDDPDNSNLDEAFDKIFGTTIGASGSGHIGYSNQGLFLQVATGYYGSFHSMDEIIAILEFFVTAFLGADTSIGDAFNAEHGTNIDGNSVLSSVDTFILIQALHVFDGDDPSVLIAYLESSPGSLDAFNKIFGTNINDPANAGSYQATLNDVAAGYFGSFHSTDEIITTLELFDTIFLDDPDNSNLDEAFNKIFGTYIDGADINIGFDQYTFINVATGHFGDFNSTDEIITTLELFDTIFLDDPDNSNLDEAFDKIFNTSIGTSSFHNSSDMNIFIDVATGHFGDFRSTDEVITALELFDAVFLNNPDNSFLDEAFDKIFNTSIGTSNFHDSSDMNIFIDVATGHFGDFRSTDEVITALELFGTVFLDDPDNSLLDEAFDKIFNTSIGTSNFHDSSDMNKFIDVATGYFGDFDSSDEVITTLELFDTIFLDDPDNSNIDEAFDKIFNTSIGTSSFHDSSDMNKFIDVATGYFGNFQANGEIIAMLEFFDIAFLGVDTSIGDAFNEEYGTNIDGADNNIAPDDNALFQALQDFNFDINALIASLVDPNEAMVKDYVIANLNATETSTPVTADQLEVGPKVGNVYPVVLSLIEDQPLFTFNIEVDGSGIPSLKSIISVSTQEDILLAQENKYTETLNPRDKNYELLNWSLRDSVSPSTTTTYLSIYHKINLGGDILLNYERVELGGQHYPLFDSTRIVDIRQAVATNLDVNLEEVYTNKWTFEHMRVDYNGFLFGYTRDESDPSEILANGIDILAAAREEASDAYRTREHKTPFVGYAKNEDGNIVISFSGNARSSRKHVDLEVTYNDQGELIKTETHTVYTNEFGLTTQVIHTIKTDSEYSKVVTNNTYDDDGNLLASTITNFGDAAISEDGDLTLLDRAGLPLGSAGEPMTDPLVDG